MNGGGVQNIYIDIEGGVAFHVFAQIGIVNFLIDLVEGSKCWQVYLFKNYLSLLDSSILLQIIPKHIGHLILVKDCIGVGHCRI